MRLLLPMVCAIAAAGCDSLGGKMKVTNPVFDEPPPRMAVSDNRTADDRGTAERPGLPFEEQRPGVIQTTHDTAPPGDQVEGSEVVARVNGQPIFASEVLERYAAHLEAARKQAPAEEFKAFRQMLLQRDLKGHIDRKLLVEAMMETLKPEQVESIEEHLDAAFEKQIDEIKQQLKVGSKQEVEQELAKQGTSLESMRKAFANQQLAGQYIQTKAKSDPKIGRREMMEYYRQHDDDYGVPAAVKWQQLVIMRNGPGGETAAEEKLRQVIADLRQDVDFGEVVKQYSDGPEAGKGGHWGDWMQAGSLADEEMERALFELPVGYISSVFERNDAYYLVKINERRERGLVPFAEVQDEIQKKLEEQDRKDAIRKVLEDLHAEATIWTIFDEQPQRTATNDAGARLPFE